MTPDPFRLDGRVALVTGGGTGLGRGIAGALAAAGARVVVAGRRADVAAEAAEEVGGLGVALDVTDLEALPAAVAGIVETVGPIDILVNNAGSTHKAPALEHDDAGFAGVVEVNLHGGFALAREVARTMAARDGGAIVFVSSLNASIGMTQTPGYAAAKAGVLGLTTALAAEWAPEGIRVNAIVPGWIDAGIAKRVLDADAERRARVQARIPMARFGTAEEVGRAVVFLTSDAGSYVTGVALPVDGGALIGL